MTIVAMLTTWNKGKQGGELIVVNDEPHISKMHLENMRKQKFDWKSHGPNLTTCVF
jgi:uncharacterized protein (DUF2249 family)